MGDVLIFLDEILTELFEIESDFFMIQQVYQREKALKHQ